uniref:NADH dehydrogenase [ubiquinone] 1 alpha subcomplex assembly factor 2 n=1 Tax=Myxine glutinosa TaxID=7769 RepID=UPI00358E5F11
MKRLWLGITSWLPSSRRITQRLVGEDPAGNKYYLVETESKWENFETKKKVRRIMVPSGSCSEEDYTPESIAPEWDAWIRGRRNEPPNLQEVQQGAARQQLFWKRGQDANEREQERSEREFQEGLISRQRPGAFEPEAWKPKGK